MGVFWNISLVLMTLINWLLKLKYMLKHIFYWIFVIWKYDILKFPFAGGRSQVSVSLFFPPCLFDSVCCGLYRARECPFISPGIVWRLARSCHAWEKQMPITGLVGAHCGGEILDRDVTMIYCRFCWIGGMKPEGDE